MDCYWSGNACLLVSMLEAFVQSSRVAALDVNCHQLATLPRKYLSTHVHLRAYLSVIFNAMFNMLGSLAFSKSINNSDALSTVTGLGRNQMELENS